mmetsp:Transcript_12195/g.28439  ORF Transcript_12195/g.28439 Transcript_12195/m.28439 type:complete len:107 (+) Transcript_12195:927-1247(+)
MTALCGSDADAKALWPQKELSVPLRRIGQRRLPQHTTHTPTNTQACSKVVTIFETPQAMGLTWYFSVWSASVGAALFQARSVGGACRNLENPKSGRLWHHLRRTAG